MCRIPKETILKKINVLFIAYFSLGKYSISNNPFWIHLVDIVKVANSFKDNIQWTSKEKLKTITKIYLSNVKQITF